MASGEVTTPNLIDAIASRSCTGAWRLVRTASSPGMTAKAVGIAGTKPGEHRARHVSLERVALFRTLSFA